MSTNLPPRPADATLSVTKAARVLGVHPNTVRTWSDAGRLRYYRINPRGDRRYRPGDLQRFLAAAEHGPRADIVPAPPVRGRGRLDRRGLAALARSDPLEGGRPGTSMTAPVRAIEERRRADLALLDRIARMAFAGADLDEDLSRLAQVICDAGRHALVSFLEVRGDRCVARASATAQGQLPIRPLDIGGRPGVIGRALEIAPVSRESVAGADDLPAVAVLSGASDRVTLSVLPGDRSELAVAIPGREGAWGVLLLVHDGIDSLTREDQDLAAVLADGASAITTVGERQLEIAHLLHRADALRRVAGDIGSRLDLDRILAGLVDHAMVLFEADRAAVFLRRPDGTQLAEVSRYLSTAYLAALRRVGPRTLMTAAIEARRPVFSIGYRDDPIGADVRAVVVQEGFDTQCSAPLMDGPDVLGLLNLYHDAPHHWTDEDLETVAALSTQAAVAIRAAQDYDRMATWTAQLQSIQQLGARLSHLTDVQEIGTTIATELHQLIDYHNVRVYRVEDDDLIPVAIQGQVGEYIDETLDQLRVKVGRGVTGWVAANATSLYLPDAAADPRADTIPGTEADLDESMLLAPMLFEDQVLGVLVLSKLGLHQFQDDDLRLLDIYASFAAQAMANADTNARLRDQSAALERQLRSQRELIGITESILTTLDRRAVLEGITDRLGSLITCDNIAIEVLDPTTGVLTPLTARGADAAFYLEPWEPGETGLATWVVEHNEPVLVADESTDERINRFRDDSVPVGSLIVVPLRDRSGAIGVLTIERVRAGDSFSPEDFDLVQLFAGQVSIALQNAEMFRAVEVRAQSDALTGLLNHGTFQEYLGRYVRDGTPFGLVMLDLDDFRDVNNTLGHQAGDEQLRRIADALSHAGRDSDLTFRYGGDEYALILPNTDPTGTAQVADRARQAVRGAEGAMSASVGVANYPLDGATASDVLLAADRACYVAKRSGRDRVATAAEGLALAAEFRQHAPTPVDSETTG